MCEHYVKAPLCPNCRAYTYVMPDINGKVFRRCPNSDYEKEIIGKELEELKARWQGLKDANMHR